MKRLSIAELVEKLHAQEQKASIRVEEPAECAFQAKHKSKKYYKKHFKDKGSKNNIAEGSSDVQKKDKFPPCGICKCKSQAEKDCWFKNKSIFHWCFEGNPGLCGAIVQRSCLNYPPTTTKGLAIPISESSNKELRYGLIAVAVFGFIIGIASGILYPLRKLKFVRHSRYRRHQRRGGYLH
ncbi:hypothetical protein JRO89_XS02G0207600 [Xanthoceras sorbifolium]|uniref:Uncharacterized protein n=1 Tax=Xanthoceras sorbifolium TaxID=99658 RepID=A0ABQ8IGD9_9ROSI|nr:hypothetical protein JRO89_XS02G0207600 [Xanthoceras sorbifolium]